MTWRDAIPWDVIEFAAKTIASVGVAVIAALKLGKRATVWIAGPRVETTLRTMFADEIASIAQASEKAGQCAHWQEASATTLDRFNQRLDAIDRDVGIVTEIVVEIMSLQEDQANFLDTALGIDRRGADTATKLSELRERAAKRRADRRVNGHTRPSDPATEEPPPIA